MKTIVCKTEQRRELVRAKQKLNGLDYLEVNCNQTMLTVFFLGKAPQKLTRDNFRIDGGRRIRDIKITKAEVIRDADPELDDRVKLELNRCGDFSTYTLHLVNVAEPIDPYYDHLDFTFKVDCPTELDCRTAVSCLTEASRGPEINYLAKDYASFRQVILDRLALVMPDWQERHLPDIGIALVEVLAYVGDYLSYYQDAVATEAYLDTARRRISVRRHARLVDYRMHEGCNARVWVYVHVKENSAITLDPRDVFFVTSLPNIVPKTQPVLSSAELANLAKSTYEVFAPLVADPGQLLQFRSVHNRISFYTWGENRCCLVKGATSATLLDGWAEEQTPAGKHLAYDAIQGKPSAVQCPPQRARKLDLKIGDVLIFAEIRGPKTGKKDDADPTHRCAIRLTAVTPAIDPLDNTPVVEIEWSPEDALPFQFCLSCLGDGDHGCVYYSDVSVALGNIVLADHGLCVEQGPHPSRVVNAKSTPECFCEGLAGAITFSAADYRPRLAGLPLTFSQPPDFTSSAALMMQQDPARAIAQVSLRSTEQLASQVIETTWEPCFDLFDSGPDQAHFVVEVDNDGSCLLRFGDGQCGRAPEAGMQFAARYRLGNGVAGNVGAETIRHLVYVKNQPHGIEAVCAPLPAAGGIDPEPASQVKLLAPVAFKKRLQRAITADDYACIAQRNGKVQRAAAELRWNGSWYEARVAIDPLGTEQVTEALLQEVDHELYRFRRMGHEVRVVAADYVSIHIGMTVCVQPGYLRGHVKAALLNIFSTRTLPNGKLGFFHPDRLTFGDSIYLSQLIAAAQAVQGVESAAVTKLERHSTQPNHELENGVLPLGPLQVARCDNDPDFPEHGRFDLTVKGGR
jgi:hypothetical protein